MKQITKTAEILAKLRASYGTDANVDALAVFEVVLANTLPLRKTGGLFKGARLDAGLLHDIANAVNAESVPIQLQHDTRPMPVGRLFSAAVVGAETRGLIAIDTSTEDGRAHAAKMDSGTIDQVSVGMVNKKLTCSRCDFDYMAASAYENRWSLTCNQDHKIGEDGTHIIVSGLDSLFETSLVGQGAVRGARVLGPSESVFQNNPRLAASSAANDGALAVHLTATVEDEKPAMDLTALTTSLTTQTEGRARAEAQVTTLTAQVETANTQITTLTSERDTAITARDTATTELASVKTELETAQAAVAGAVDALTAEVKAVLTALGKNEDEIAAAIKDKDALGLLSIVQEHRAQFAAIIPPGGKSTPADTPALKASSQKVSAFRTPRN